MTKRISFVSNNQLGDPDTSGATSTVGEPSIATNGDKMFMTGNWYASKSQDGGSTWEYVNPYTKTRPAAGGFCCDQLAMFDNRRKIWIWILQYRKRNDTNVFRIAICKDANFQAGRWYWWDFAPSRLNSSWTKLWFDYPDGALSSEHLYLTFNMFDVNDRWQRAAVMRFSLDTLANAGGLSTGFWTTTSYGSLRLTQQASPTSKMYFVAHQSTSRLRLFSWPSNSNSISNWSIPVNGWSGSISSRAPNGVDWLARTDTRITGAAVKSGEITVMWTVGAKGNRPNPHIRVVKINESSKTVTSQPDIWSSLRAWAYPATCYNSRGELGFVAFYGGNDRNPGHICGARDSNTWVIRYSNLGSHSPSEAKWGDYLNCRADCPEGNCWVGSGYTLRGGSSRTDIVPRVARFKLETVTSSAVQPETQKETV